VTDQPSDELRASATLRRLILPVYLPIIAGTVGLGMLIPVLPLYLAAADLSLQMTSVVLAGLGLGAAIGGLPAGAVLARLSERRVMVGSLLILAICTAVLGFTTTAVGLLGLRLVSGAASNALRLSRQTYITRRVTFDARGRAMSMIGGSFRLALLVGPVLGGTLVDAVGFRSTFMIAGALTAIGIIPVLAPSQELPELAAAQVSNAPQTKLMAALRQHRRLLMVSGMVPMLAMTVREGRFVVLPLIGQELGLSATEIGVLVTVGTAADLVLFPVAGLIMDRLGRLYTVVPAFALIGAGLVVVGFADSTATVVIGGAIIGIGNGLGSGSMLTLGSDLAPPEATAPFLAGIGVIQDSGRVLGPLIVGAVGAWIGLGAAALALAIACAVLIMWMVFVLGETSDRQAAASVS
jgi:MFS family permease